jgi:hypothetical protein
MRTVFVLGALFLAGCTSSVVEGDEQNVTATKYYDLDVRLAGDRLARWDARREALIDSFDDVCGDTFCSGDYSNLTTVAVECSVTQSDYVRECSWILGGSIEYVDGATGTFKSDARMFACTIPVKAKVDVFLDALDEDPSTVRAVMPATGQSFYDGIATCLAGVVGQPPPAATGSTYLELADYFNENPDPGFWFGVRRGLNAAFASECDDTLCGETWQNIGALRFVCATASATGEIQSCLWNFGVANTKVTTKGKVSSTRKIVGCPITASGGAVALEAALSGSDPLGVTLPGASKPLRDQLADCL